MAWHRAISAAIRAVEPAVDLTVLPNQEDLAGAVALASHGAAGVSSAHLLAGTNVRRSIYHDPCAVHGSAGSLTMVSIRAGATGCLELSSA